MIRVIYGEDEFSVDERVRQIQESIGPQEVRAPNTTILEGDSYSLEQLLAAASAVPFLADRRMVIVRGLLGRLDGDQQRQRRGGGTGRRRLPKGDWSRLANGLSALPSTIRGWTRSGPRPVSWACRCSFIPVIRRNSGSLTTPKTRDGWSSNCALGASGIPLPGRPGMP